MDHELYNTSTAPMHLWRDCGRTMLVVWIIKLKQNLNDSWPKHHLNNLKKDKTVRGRNDKGPKKTQDELTRWPMGKWTKWLKTKW